VRRKRGTLLALLLIAAALTAGCASTEAPVKAPSSSANALPALTKLAKSYGRAYVEQSNDLPDTIETR
jgi:hypothetical protein